MVVVESAVGLVVVVVVLVATGFDSVGVVSMVVWLAGCFGGGLEVVDGFLFLVNAVKASRFKSMTVS